MRLIDADELLKTYALFVAPSNNSDFEKEPTWNDAVSLLESAPTVDPVSDIVDIIDDPKTTSIECHGKRFNLVKPGHWIEIDRGLLWQCSECEHYSISGGYYCDWCGAKMDEADSEVKDE